MNESDDIEYSEQYVSMLTDYIEDLEKQNAALEAKLRWCYDTSMFRFVTPIITYQNWLDMIQMIEGRT